MPFKTIHITAESRKDTIRFKNCFNTGAMPAFLNSLITLILLEFISCADNYPQRKETYNINATIKPEHSIPLGSTSLVMEDFNTTKLHDNSTKDTHVKLILTISYTTIFIMGVPGNTLLLVSVLRLKHMRITTNLLMVNLILGDILNLIWCIPISVTALYVSWPFGDFFCKYIFPIADVIIGNTIYTILAIALERYRAITNPMLEELSMRVIILISCSVWILSYLLIGLPLSFANSISKGYWVELSCNLNWLSPEHEVAYRIGQILGLLLIPTVLMAFSFVRMRSQLLQSINFAKSSMSPEALKTKTLVNRKIIRCLFVIVVCFAICFVPIQVLLIVRTFYRNIVYWPPIGTLFQISFLLLLCHSVINPVILCVMSQEFRQAILRQLACCGFKVQIRGRGVSKFSRKFRSTLNKSTENIKLGSVVKLAHDSGYLLSEWTNSADT